MAKSTFGSENAEKHPMLGTLFDVLMSKKLHAAVAKSTLGSQNAKKLKVREHLLKF